MTAKVRRLGEGGYSTTNFHSKPTLYNYEKLSLKIINSSFCQTAVCSLLLLICSQYNRSVLQQQRKQVSKAVQFSQATFRIESLSY